MGPLFSFQSSACSSGTRIRTLIATSRVWRPAIRRSPIASPPGRGTNISNSVGGAVKPIVFVRDSGTVGGNGALLLGGDRRRQETRGQRGQLPRRQEALALHRRRRHGRTRVRRNRLAPRGPRVPQRDRG